MSLESEIAAAKKCMDFVMKNAPKTASGDLPQIYRRFVNSVTREIEKAEIYGRSLHKKEV